MPPTTLTLPLSRDQFTEELLPVSWLGAMLILALVLFNSPSPATGCLTWLIYSTAPLLVDWADGALPPRSAARTPMVFAWAFVVTMHCARLFGADPNTSYWTAAVLVLWPLGSSSWVCARLLRASLATAPQNAHVADQDLPVQAAAQ